MNTRNVGSSGGKSTAGQQRDSSATHSARSATETERNTMQPGDGEEGLGGVEDLVGQGGFEPPTT